MSQDTKTLEIVLKGRDDGLTSLLGTANRQVSTLAQQLRQGGDIGELSGIKKFGKNVGEFLGTNQAGEISKGADQLRAQAQADYGKELAKTTEIERTAMAVDKARTGAMLERSRAAVELQRNLREIDSREKMQIAGLQGRNLLVGERGVGEIKQDSADSRAAAEKAYQEVLNRSVDVQSRAAASDRDRAKAALEKDNATRKYLQTLKEIDKAEADAQKANRSANALGRGIAVAGGTLAAVNLAGGVAEAWDKANQKIEEGKIGANEFVGELAKGLPIIGGTVQKAETLLMVITGTAKALREANKEAAELDKKINGQNADRKRVDDIVAGTKGLNDNDKQKINRDANAKLKEIRDARKAGEASGVINEGNDRDIELKKAEAEIIKKREADLGKVEAEERAKRNRQVQEVDKRLADGKKTIEEQRTAQQIADLKERGDKEGAAILQIKADAAAKLKALDEERTKLNGETGLTDKQRIGLNNSIDERKTAVAEDASAKIAAEKRANDKEAAEKTYDMQRKILQLQSDGGNKTVERELKKLDILKQYQETQKQIDEMLKDSALSEEQRASLRAQRAALPGLADKAILQSGKEDAQARLQTQLGEKSSLMDTRGQSAFFNQSKATTAEQEMAKVTKESTKATTDLTKMLADTLKPLLEKLNTPGNEGWLD